METPKYNAGLFFLIFSIPILYFLTIDKRITPSSSSSSIINDSKINKSVKKEMRESSTQTSISDYDISHLEIDEKIETKLIQNINSVNSDIQLKNEVCNDKSIDEFCSIEENIQSSEEKCKNKTPDIEQPKRILDYFAYIVGGK